jgi:hypothetical protein
MRATVMFNGSVYSGKVIRATATRVLVKFTTGTGWTRESWFKTVEKPVGTLVSRRHWPVDGPADAVTIPANSGFINVEVSAS